VTCATVCNVKLSSLIISVEKAAAMMERENDPPIEPPAPGGNPKG
jgi:hypothetical protein